MQEHKVGFWPALSIGVVIGLLPGMLFGCVAGMGMGAASSRSAATPSTKVVASTAAPVTSPAASPRRDAHPEPTTPPPQPVEVSDWIYSETPDEMTGKVERTACTTSQTTVSLSFPYGERRPRLCLRRSPKYGVDAFISLDGSGQFQCNSFTACTIKVRLDEGAVQSFSAVGPSDNSTETIFIQNDARFIAAVSKAKIVRVEAEFFQNGQQMMRFPTRGLKW